MTPAVPFHAVYDTASLYNRRRLPHYYHGREDVDLVTEVLACHYSDATAKLAILELGCGTGRITEKLVPYARRLVATDNSTAMLDVVRSRYSQVSCVCADTRDVVAVFRTDEAHGFDVVVDCWSLSYPLGAYYETLTAEGVHLAEDTARSRVEATRFVHDLVMLLAPSGHLVVLFFDANTPEQRLVTRQWERIAPFPEGGRGYTLNLLLRGLRQAEDEGQGTLRHTRWSGTAWAPSYASAIAWFYDVHFMSLPALVGNPQVQHEVTAFVERHTLPDGSVALPSGVHLIDFHAISHPSCHLPRHLP